MASNSVFTAEKTEIGEIESFSVRRTGWETWDASLPWDSLADCVQTVMQAYAMPPGSIARGTVYQVQTLPDNYRPQSILQWLGTEDKAYVLSLYYDELPSLASALSVLADYEGLPLDLDMDEMEWRNFSSNVLKVVNTDPNGLAPRVTALEAEVGELDETDLLLQTQIDSLDSRADGLEPRVTDLEADLTLAESEIDGIQIQVTDLDGDVASLNSDVSGLDSRTDSLEDLTTTGRLSTASLGAAYAAKSEGAKALTGKVAADLPSTYPTGVSYHSGSSGGGWPGNLVTVETVKFSANRTMQIVVAKTSGATSFRSETDGDLWGPWVPVSSGATFVQKGELVVNVLDHGVIGNGSTDDSVALAALLSSVAPGSTLLFPGGKQYVISQLLTTSGKSINIDARGAKFLFTSSNAGFTFEGGFDSSLSVSSLEAIIVTPNSHDINAVRVVTGAAAPTSWRRGDIVRVYADDIIPGSRDSGDPAKTQQGRVGQYLEVLSTSGSEAILVGVLDDFSAYSTNVRVARLKSEVRFSWAGGDFDYTDTAMAETIAGNHVIKLASLYRPEVSSLEVRRFPRIAVQVLDCHSWKVQADIGYGINNLAQARYGYGVANYGSCYGTLYNTRFGQVRHGYINGHSFIATGTGLPQLHGRPHDNSIINCMCESSSNAAFDSHTTGLRERYVACYADNARTGFSFRGKGHMMQGCSVTNSGTAVSMIQEDSGGVSEGHQINDLRAENVNNVFVSNLGDIAGSVTYQTLVTIPTVINGVRARNVKAREFEITYNTVYMSDWYVRRAPTGLPGLVRKSVLEITDYTVDMLDASASPFLEMGSVSGGAGDRNQVRLRNIYIKNTVTNLTYLVQGSAVADGRVSSTEVEADFPPVTGVMSQVFDKLSRRVYLADYV